MITFLCHKINYSYFFLYFCVNNRLGTFDYLVISFTAASSCGTVQNSVGGSQEGGGWFLGGLSLTSRFGGVSRSKLAVNYIFEYTSQLAVHTWGIEAAEGCSHTLLTKNLLFEMFSKLSNWFPWGAGKQCAGSWGRFTSLLPLLFSPSHHIAPLINEKQTYRF